jgi:hypothetical protein
MGSTKRIYTDVGEGGECGEPTPFAQPRLKPSNRMYHEANLEIFGGEGGLWRLREKEGMFWGAFARAGSVHTQIFQTSLFRT